MCFKKELQTASFPLKTQPLKVVQVNNFTPSHFLLRGTPTWWTGMCWGNHLVSFWVRVTGVVYLLQHPFSIKAPWSCRAQHHTSILNTRLRTRHNSTTGKTKDFMRICVLFYKDRQIYKLLVRAFYKTLSFNLECSAHLSGLARINKFSDGWHISNSS